MKKLIKFILNKTVGFLKWIWEECKDWHTLVLLGIVSLVLSFPIWLGYLVGFIFDLPWAIVVATSVWGFWMLPGAPFFALAISITLGIKKGLKKAKKWKNSKAEEEPSQTADGGDLDQK